MAEELPYCTCNRARNSGFTQGPDGFFVHAECMKPTKFVYDHLAMPRLLAGPKADDILRRREVFEQRVQERTDREIEAMAKEYGLAVAVVKLIWDKY